MAATLYAVPSSVCLYPDTGTSRAVPSFRNRRRPGFGDYEATPPALHGSALSMGRADQALNGLARNTLDVQWQRADAASSSLRRLFWRMRVAVLKRLGKWRVAALILAAV